MCFRGGFVHNFSQEYTLGVHVAAGVLFSEVLNREVPP